MSERRKPEIGETYYFTDAVGNVSCFVWRGDSMDSLYYDSGNCFKTKEEAKAASEEFKDLLTSLHEPTKDRNQLPKLTSEVFDRKDCPAWANFAAMDKDGTVFYYRQKPFITADKWHPEIVGDCSVIYQLVFDASDWQNSLIKRPAKLPEWCKVDAICWHKRCGYFKITYIDDVSKRVDIQQVEDTSRGYFSFNTICNEVKQARLRPYNAEEMRGLVGKVIEVEPGHFSLCLRVKGLWADFLDDCDNEDDRARIISYDCDMLKHRNTIDGQPCGVLEHLNEKGEWVK